jgi:hypothetical protein
MGEIERKTGIAFCHFGAVLGRREQVSSQASAV